MTSYVCGQGKYLILNMRAVSMNAVVYVNKTPEKILITKER